MNRPVLVQRDLSLLDPVLLTDSCKRIESSVITVDRSVNDPQRSLVSIEIHFNLKLTYKREVLLYKRADYELFHRLIANFPWNDTFSEYDNVNKACELFTETYLNMAKQYIPTNSVTIRPKDKTWMTSELRKNIRIRNRLHKRARSSKLPIDITKFKSQRNKVNNMKKFARLNFYENVHGIIDQYSNSDP